MVRPFISPGCMAGQFFADGVADEFGAVRVFLSSTLIQPRHELSRHPNCQQPALWLFP